MSLRHNGNQRMYLFFIVLFFLRVTQALAASISLSDGPATLTESGEYTVQLMFSINTADNTPYYLRGVFYKPGTTNYCGFTWNGNDWYSGPYSSNDGWKNFLPITITNNAWAGMLKAKIDTSDSGCKESGKYNFKVERFTPSGSGTYDSQNEQTVSAVVPTVTPTPLPPTSTPTLLPTITRILTVSVVNQKIIPLSGQVKTNTPAFSPVSSSQAVLHDSIATHESLVTFKTPTEKPIIKKAPEKKLLVKSAQAFSFLPFLFLLILPLILIGCGILVFVRTRKHA